MNWPTATSLAKPKRRPAKRKPVALAKLEFFALLLLPAVDPHRGPSRRWPPASLTWATSCRVGLDRSLVGQHLTKQPAGHYTPVRTSASPAADFCGQSLASHRRAPSSSL